MYISIEYVSDSMQKNVKADAQNSVTSLFC